MPVEKEFSVEKSKPDSKNLEREARRARILGQILRRNSKLQSNSRELYLLYYLEELGLPRI